MRKLGNWGVTAALVWGLSTAALLAADTPSGKSRPKGPPPWRKTPVWAKANNWFNPAEDKAADPKKGDDKKPDAKSGKEPAVPPEPAAKPAAAPVEGVGRSPEEAAFLRRSEACLKLKEIAFRTNDPELHRRAEQLDEKAWAAYEERLSSKLAGEKFEPDDKPMERLLNSGAIEKPSKSSTKIHTVPGKDTGRHASLKEGK